jgi:hypothetical protein
MPLLRSVRFITIPLVIVAIGATIVAFRVDLASLLSLEATPTATEPERRVASRDVETEGSAKPILLEPPQDRPADPLPATFNVIRIDPEGTSEFAGRGPAGTLLTILANGVVVATVRANDEGRWAIALEHRFDPGEYQFALAPKADEGGPSLVGQPVSPQLVVVKKPAFEYSPVARLLQNGQFRAEVWRRDVANDRSEIAWSDSELASTAAMASAEACVSLKRNFDPSFDCPLAATPAPHEDAAPTAAAAPRKGPPPPPKRRARVVRTSVRPPAKTPATPPAPSGGSDWLKNFWEVQDRASGGGGGADGGGGGGE